MPDVTLTEEERDGLWESIESAYLDTTTYSRESEDAIEQAVCRIVRERLVAAGVCA